MKSKAIHYAVIKHDYWNDSHKIIGCLTTPENINYFALTEEEHEELLHQCFEKWHLHTFGRAPETLHVEWEIQPALIEISTEKKDILRYFNR